MSTEMWECIQCGAQGENRDAEATLRRHLEYECKNRVGKSNDVKQSHGTSHVEDQLFKHISRMTIALELSAANSVRIAAALERQTAIMEQVADINPNAEAEAATVPKSEAERSDDWTPEEEEQYASIQMLEEMGVPVPAAAYKRLGIDPPEREDEPTQADMDDDQPGAEQEEKGE